MSSKVKIVLAGINAACLLVTLLFPSTATPLLLLTTIAPVVSWAFTTQEQPATSKERLVLYIVVWASVLAAICIAVGVLTFVEQPDVQNNPGYYVFTFHASVAGVGNTSFNYFGFAIPMFFAIFFLMLCEVVASFDVNRADAFIPQPLARDIAQQLAKFN